MSALGLEDVRRYLPETMQEIVNIIGVENLEKFLNNFSGSTIRFTRGDVYFPLLENCLGAELAGKLVDYFEHEFVYIRRCHVALRILRNYRFKAEYDYLTQDKGMSGRQAMIVLAPKYQLSDRALWGILRDTR